MSDVADRVKKIVIEHLGAATAGYYYLSFMIVNLLYTVSNSVSQSLFAEGSYGGSLRNLLGRSAIILVAIMVPAAIILAIFGPFVLDFFGKSYSAGGSSVIVILALAAPVVAASNLGGVLLKITRRVYSLVAINFVYAVVISVLTFYWVDRGLVWVAIAWGVGNLVAAVCAFLFISYYHYRHLSAQKLSIAQG